MFNMILLATQGWVLSFVLPGLMLIVVLLNLATGMAVASSESFTLEPNFILTDSLRIKNINETAVFAISPIGSNTETQRKYTQTQN
jgi:hypothetical protein